MTDDMVEPEVELEVVGFAHRDLLTGDIKLIGYTRTDPTRLFALKYIPRQSGQEQPR